LPLSFKEMIHLEKRPRHPLPTLFPLRDSEWYPILTANGKGKSTRWVLSGESSFSCFEGSVTSSLVVIGHRDDTKNTQECDVSGDSAAPTPADRLTTRVVLYVRRKDPLAEEAQRLRSSIDGGGHRRRPRFPFPCRGGSVATGRGEESTLNLSRDQLPLLTVLTTTTFSRITVGHKQGL